MAGLFDLPKEVMSRRPMGHKHFSNNPVNKYEQKYEI